MSSQNQTILGLKYILISSLKKEMERQNQTILGLKFAKSAASLSNVTRPKSDYFRIEM